MSAKYTKEEITYATERLRELLPFGSNVYTCLRHVSTSGALHRMTLHAICDGELIPITHLVAKALGYSLNRDIEITVKGGGMDMCRSVVDDLAWKMNEGYNPPVDGASTRFRLRHQSI